MILLSVPVAVLFGIAGSASELRAGRGWPDVAERLARPTFFAALPLYVAWALAQQTLFQFYLLGRVRALAPHAPPLAPAMRP